MLIVIAGLPGSGKSTVADDLANALDCAVLGVDPAEAAMWRAGISRSEPTHHAAYLVVEALAAEQLALGHDVIIDAVNGPEEARAHWRRLADRSGAELKFIEVQCSDEHLHQRRLAGRIRRIEGFPEPTWEGVLRRRAEFPVWTDHRLTLDTVNSRAGNLKAALEYLGWARQPLAQGRGDDEAVIKLMRTAEMNCVLCSDDLSPVLDVSTFWRLVLNRNQNLVGKTLLVSRRHIEVVDQLSADEWHDLRLQVRRIASALTQVARPDHFNYAFLQNQDRHVHLHVIPRYASPRIVMGIGVDDPDYPDHYAVPAPHRPLDPVQEIRLADLLRAAL